MAKVNGQSSPGSMLEEKRNNLVDLYQRGPGKESKPRKLACQRFRVRVGPSTLSQGH